MRLREIISQLIGRKYGTQTALALAVNPMPPGVERAKPADIQRMASAGRNQEKQFAIILKLLPMCKELGIDPAQELESKALAGGLLYDTVGTASKIDQRKKKASGKK